MSYTANVETDSVFYKDPDAVLDYKFDWAASTNGSGDSDWLDTDNSETIATITVTADTGLTVDSSAKSDSDTSVVAWLSSGTAGEDYEVTCQIVTSGSRTDERTITIKVRER